MTLAHWAKMNLNFPCWQPPKKVIGSSNNCGLEARGYCRTQGVLAGYCTVGEMLGWKKPKRRKSHLAISRKQQQCQP